MRASFATLLLVIAGCRCDEKPRAQRGDVVVETTSPVRAAVRTFEYDVSPVCTETGLAQLKCLVGSVRRGCTWLEVGAEVEGPGPLGIARADRGAHFPCDVPPGEQRVFLDQAEAASGTKLTADEDGHRLLVTGGKAFGTRAYFVIEGRVLSLPQVTTMGAILGTTPMGPLGLSESSPPPTFNAALRYLAWTLDDGRRTRLFDELRAKGGDAAVSQLLLDARDSSLSEGWAAEFERLGPDEKRRVTDAFIARVSSDVDVDHDALQWFFEHPELQPPGFADALARGLRGRKDGFEPAPSNYLAELVRRKDPRAGSLACRQLELGYGNALDLESGLGEDDGDIVTTALATVAATKTKCKWVTLLLEREPCSEELRCDGEGSSPTPYGDEGPVDAHPLCSPAFAQQAVDELLSDSGEFPRKGQLLLAAALVQGPLPADLVTRNARRLYRFEQPDSDDGELGSCGLMTNLTEMVCSASPSLDTLLVHRCRLRIDDRAKVIHLSQED